MIVVRAFLAQPRPQRAVAATVDAFLAGEAAVAAMQEGAILLQIATVLRVKIQQQAQRAQRVIPLPGRAPSVANATAAPHISPWGSGSGDADTGALKVAIRPVGGAG